MSSVKHAARFVHHDGMTVYADRLTPTAMTEKPPVVMIHRGGHSGTCYLLRAADRPGRRCRSRSARQYPAGSHGDRGD